MDPDTNISKEEPVVIKEHRSFHVDRKIVYVLAVGIIAVLVFLLTLTSTTYEYKDISLSETRDVVVASMKDADGSIVEKFPPANDMSDSSAEDAEKLFAVSRASTVFDFGDRSVGYLIRILDSESPEFNPYKSIAAYFLVHSFYDSGGDIVFMADAVGQSSYMLPVTTKAQELFPELFAVPLDEMSYSEKSLYFASYLIALSEREDSIAIPGNAVLELSRAYVTMAKNPQSALYRTVSIESVESLLHEQIKVFNGRFGELEMPLKEPFVMMPHDMLVGINTFSSSVNVLKQQGLSRVFPEITTVDSTENFSYSYALAKQHVASLFQFTNYSYLKSIINFPKYTKQENLLIDDLVKNLVTEPPYERVNNNWWVFKLIERSSPGASVYDIYHDKDIEEIARRSENFSDFLVHSDLSAPLIELERNVTSGNHEESIKNYDEQISKASGYEEYNLFNISKQYSVYFLGNDGNKELAVENLKSTINSKEASDKIRAFAVNAILDIYHEEGSKEVLTLALSGEGVDSIQGTGNDSDRNILKKLIDLSLDLYQTSAGHKHAAVWYADELLAAEHLSDTMRKSYVAKAAEHAQKSLDLFGSEAHLFPVTERADLNQSIGFVFGTSHLFDQDKSTDFEKYLKAVIAFSESYSGDAKIQSMVPYAHFYYAAFLDRAYGTERAKDVQSQIGRLVTSMQKHNSGESKEADKFMAFLKRELARSESDRGENYEFISRLAEIDPEFEALLSEV